MIKTFSQDRVKMFPWT